MNTILLWVFQILLAIWFGFGAYNKLSMPQEKMVNNKALPFDGNPIPIRILGVLEFLGAIGILVSQAFYPPLTAITAICFSLVMFGATIFHIQKKHYKPLPIIILAFILSLIVAYYRFQ